MSINQHSAITDILQTVDSITVDMVAHGYQQLVQGYSSAILTCLTLFTMFSIYRMKIGRLSTEACSQQLLKMLFFYLLATNWGVFYTLIFNVFTNEPANITKVLVSSTGHLGMHQSTATALDQVFDQGMAQASALFGMVSWNMSAFAYILGGIIVFLATGALTLIALAMIVYAKIGLALVLFLAPLFCLFPLFETTRGWFDSWMRQCLNFALIPILVCGVLMILLSIANETLVPLKADITRGTPGMTAVVMYGALGFITAWILKQVYSKAAALSGGFALSHIGGAATSAKTMAASMIANTKKAYQGGQSVKGAIKENYDARQAKQAQATKEAEAAEKRRKSLWHL